VIDAARQQSEWSLLMQDRQHSKALCVCKLQCASLCMARMVLGTMTQESGSLVTTVWCASTVEAKRLIRVISGDAKVIAPVLLLRD
jgi:hypothetical protein